MKLFSKAWPLTSFTFKKMIRIVVLTSKENFVWYNMQEIIPYIESSWESLNSESFEVVTFNIDSMSLAELTPKLIGADRLVITCFNYRMCKVMQYIREILKLNLNFIVYVHNLSTIAFWPYRYFSSSELFYKSDVFITSCENDKSVLQTVFINPNIHIIPFFIKNRIESTKQVLERPQNIVYVGQISPQKNLHNLILAYSRLKKRLIDSMPPLVLFGKEDHLGCPNMGIRNESYLEFLNELCGKLEISSSVFFKGHVEPEIIDDFLNQKANLFVSTSLHSDENFGMAVLQALLTRNRTVLSDWGGHSDFKTKFPLLVSLIPVSMSEYGPTLSAAATEKIIEEALIEENIHPSFCVNPYYEPSYYLAEQAKAASYEFDKTPLNYSVLSTKIYEAKMDYTTSSSKIFSGFNDPLFHEISKFYIGSTPAVEFSAEIYSYEAVPWMSFSDDTFMIDDPQKGPFLIQNDLDEIKNFTIFFSNHLTVRVSSRICKRLFSAGYINKLETITNNK